MTTKTARPQRHQNPCWIPHSPQFCHEIFAYSPLKESQEYDLHLRALNINSPPYKPSSPTPSPVPVPAPIINVPVPPQKEKAKKEFGDICPKCRRPYKYDHVAWAWGQTDGYTCRCKKDLAPPPSPPLVLLSPHPRTPSPKTTASEQANPTTVQPPTQHSFPYVNYDQFDRWVRNDTNYLCLRDNLLYQDQINVLEYHLASLATWCDQHHSLIYLCFKVVLHVFKYIFLLRIPSDYHPPQPYPSSLILSEADFRNNRCCNNWIWGCRRRWCCRSLSTLLGSIWWVSICSFAFASCTWRLRSRSVHSWHSGIDQRKRNRAHSTQRQIRHSWRTRRKHQRETNVGQRRLMARAWRRQQLVRQRVSQTNIMWTMILQGHGGEGSWLRIKHPPSWIWATAVPRICACALLVVWGGHSIVNN